SPGETASVAAPKATRVVARQRDKGGPRKPRGPPPSTPGRDALFVRAAPLRSGGFDQPKLGERGDAVVEADLLDDLPVDHLQDRRAREVHLAAGRRGETADQEVVKRRAGVGATTFPLADDVVTFGDQIRGSPEVEVGERGTEVGHERLDVVASAARLVARRLWK